MSNTNKKKSISLSSKHNSDDYSEDHIIKKIINIFLEDDDFDVLMRKWFKKNKKK